MRTINSFVISALALLSFGGCSAAPPTLNEQPHDGQSARKSAKISESKIEIKYFSGPTKPSELVVHGSGRLVFRTGDGNLVESNLPPQVVESMHKGLVNLGFYRISEEGLRVERTKASLRTFTNSLTGLVSHGATTDVVFDGDRFMCSVSDGVSTNGIYAVEPFRRLNAHTNLPAHRILCESILLINRDTGYLLFAESPHAGH